MLGLLVQNQPHRAGTHLRGKLLRRIAHQTFFSGEMVSANPGAVQNLVNLLYREEEREMLPLCAAEGIGVIPWSPQARGKLSRDWDYTSIRTETDEAFGRLFANTQEADRKVVDRLAEVATARGIPRAQLALAWLFAKPGITSPIVGATRLQH